MDAQDQTNGVLIADGTTEQEVLVEEQVSEAQPTTLVQVADNIEKPTAETTIPQDLAQEKEDKPIEDGDKSLPSPEDRQAGLSAPQEEVKNDGEHMMNLDGDAGDDDSSDESEVEEVTDMSAFARSLMKKDVSSVAEVKDDASNDSDTSDSSDEDVRMLDKLIAADSGDEHEDGDTKQAPRTVHEQQEPEIEAPDNVDINEDAEIVNLGSITALNTTSGTITVKSPFQNRKPLEDFSFIETQTVVCTSTRQTIGIVSDVIGNIKSPHYRIRLHKDFNLEEVPLTTDQQVYRVESLSHFSSTSVSRAFRATDASNAYDEELADHEMSDDSDPENRAQGQRGRGGKANAGGRGKRGRDSRGRPDRRPDFDGDYRPLRRPENFEEMRRSQPPNQRGRGGHYDRGRGRSSRGGYDGHNSTQYDNGYGNSGYNQSMNIQQPAPQQYNGNMNGTGYQQNAYGAPANQAQYASSGNMGGQAAYPGAQQNKGMMDTYGYGANVQNAQQTMPQHFYGAPSFGQPAQGMNPVAVPPFNVPQEHAQGFQQWLSHQNTSQAGHPQMYGQQPMPGQPQMQMSGIPQSYQFQYSHGAAANNQQAPSDPRQNSANQYQPPG